MTLALDSRVRGGALRAVARLRIARNDTRVARQRRRSSIAVAVGAVLHGRALLNP